MNHDMVIKGRKCHSLSLSNRKKKEEKKRIKKKKKKKNARERGARRSSFQVAGGWVILSFYLSAVLCELYILDLAHLLIHYLRVT